MQKIRVLFTIPNFITAGSGREMFNIIERLDKDRFDIYIAIQREGGSLYNEIVAKKYPILTLPFTVSEQYSIGKKIMTAIRYAAPFRRYKFDIWQSFNWSSDFTEALVARFAGAKFIYVKKNMNWDRAAWKVKSFLSNAVIARNITLINGHLSPWYFRRKTYLVPGAVNITAKVNDPGIRQELHIPANVPLIACVAQIVRVKDQLTLIKAISKVKEVHLVLAGSERDEKYAAELRTFIEKNQLADRVHMTGAVSNVHALLSATDIFVLPTTDRFGHEEGCPVALLEAMAAGVPAIASDVAGSRDLVTHNKTGLLFQPGNEAELTECVRTYINSRSYGGQLAAAALHKIKQYHTLEGEATAFANIFIKLSGDK